MTYGACTYLGGQYRVELKPHVSLRFKSVFKSIPFGSTPPFLLADRPDLAVDLDWFFARYPVAMCAETRQHLADSKARWHQAREEAMQIVSDDWLPPAATGFRENRKPYPYQVRAAELAKRTKRLLLLDDVGLGKTISALAMIADGGLLPAVVVVPPHLSGQWIEEYIRVFTRLAAYEIKTTKPGPLPPADIYVFRYSNIAGWADYAGQIGHRAVIFDEIQELRHGEDAAKGRAGKAFCNCDSVELRIGLTATPIYNYGSEIFNVLEYIAPGSLGSWEEFRIEWCTSLGTHLVVQDPDALGAYLRDEHVALRRTEADAEVNSALPALNRLTLEVDWNDADVEVDREIQRQLAQKVLSGSFTERGQAARELDLLMRQETGIAKARSVAAYVRMLVEGGEKVLLAGWHREVYRIWQETLSDLRPVLYTGSETAARKAISKRSFMSGETDVMIMSLRSGAGTDGLQDVCAHIVIGELDWSPQVHKQIIGRLRRPGQKRQVTAHFLHVEGGSDPVLMEMLGLKASQAHSIVDPYTQASAPEMDDTRMRQLAKKVLGQ